MTLRPRNLFLSALVALAIFLFAQFAAGKKPRERAPASIDQHAQVLHALNRLTFGARPGDVERVSKMGVQTWIEQQLHPERIDDHALETRLAPLRTLRMQNHELFDNFPTQELIKEVAEGKFSMPSDPLQRAIYRAQLERYENKKDRKNGGGEQLSRAEDSGAYVDREELLDLPPDQRMREFLKLSPDQQRSHLGNAKSERIEEFLQGLDPRQRETVIAIENPQQVVTSELIQAKLLRAIYSERQLEEVMTDFWLNHFNVFIGKGADRYLLTSYERDVIRPHALGKFEDLLVATACSPAMLFYLDNWMSVGPDSDFANGVRERIGRRGRRVRRINPATAGKGKRQGLNENYGRELMELHTLGVTGGYTQKDVTEVARVFTGWTLKKPREGGDFTFDKRMHEPGEKKLLGHRIKENGEKEGLDVLHLLARHPSTAKFISTKLAVRFVSDDPPAALVQRMSETFLKKKGDIREVLRTMLESPEFWSAESYRAKVKTPLEFVVSSLRASGAEVSDAAPLARQLQNLGMPLYGMQPPTGYSSKAEAWVNSAALLGRMNFALSLAAGKVKGVQIDAGEFQSPPETPASAQNSLAILESKLLPGNVSQQTHDTILAQLEKAKPAKMGDNSSQRDVQMIKGLLLGSPEFQRR
jgi:uncharacterized protein (DUF1800 family)